MAIDPVTPATLYVGTEGGGVFRSTNGGGSSNVYSSGLTVFFAYALAIDPKTPTTVYAGTYGGGVFKIEQLVKSYLPLILRGK